MGPSGSVYRNDFHVHHTVLDRPKTKLAFGWAHGQNALRDSGCMNIIYLAKGRTSIRGNGER